MAQVVFFLRADGAVGDEHADLLPRERADRMVGVDPRVDTRRRLELRPWRPELHGHHGRAGRAKKREERRHTSVRYLRWFSLYPAGGANRSSASGATVTDSTVLVTVTFPSRAMMPAIGPLPPILICISVS